MPRPKFGPEDKEAEVRHYILQFIRQRKAWSLQECKSRLAGIAALASVNHVELGSNFYAIVRGLSYNKTKTDDVVEEIKEEQRQPQLVAPVEETKPTEPVRSGSILDEMDEQENRDGKN